LTEALGHEACRKGYEVLYRRTAVPMDWIQSGLGYGAHLKRLKQVGSVQLLILDDFGFTPLSEPRQADLYELICERYEKHSTILTSKRFPSGDWRRSSAIR
jgi:DNA replication protein DnaC